MSDERQPFTEQIKHLIVRHEGLKLFPYHCPAGKLTIGYGRNIEDRGISKEEADHLLQNDIELAIRCLSQNAPCFETLSEVRQGVLIDMFYNLGWPALKAFRQMFSALQVGDYPRAADEMLNSRWAQQVTHRSEALIRMMRTDQWPDWVT